MVRPKSKKDTILSKAIPIKFSIADLKTIKTKATKKRLPVSTYLRNVILENI